MTNPTSQNWPRVLTQSLALCLALFSPSIWADWEPFTLEHGNIVIEVEVAGRPARAILDSGASVNMIRGEIVEEHGREFKTSGQVEMQGVYGKQKVPMYSDIPIKMFGADVVLNDAVSIPDLGVEILVGGGFFRNAIVQIDYPKSRIRRLSEKAVDMKKHANVPMKRIRGSRFPAIQVEHNGVEAWLLFDTGNSGGMLVKRRFATDSGWLNEQTEVTQKMAAGIFETADVLNFHLDSFRVGPYELDNVSIYVPVEDNTNDFGQYFRERTIGTRIKKGVQAKGIVGYDVFKHFIVTIDYMHYLVNFYAPGS